jgi:hypothetical protein
MAPTTASFRRMLTLVVLAGLLGAACGDDSDGGVSLQEDTQLSAQLTQLQRTGGSAPLRELTGGDWSRVHVFHEPVSRDFVERTVGSRIDMPDTFTVRNGQILVFTDGGQVRRAVYTGPPRLFDGEYGTGATVSADQPGAALLRLTDAPS